MAVPKSRHTKSKKNRRRAHIFLKSPVLTNCPKCRKPILPHTACRYCGFYGGKEIINVLERLETKEKKKREKEMKTMEKQEVEKEKPLNLKELSKK